MVFPGKTQIPLGLVFGIVTSSQTTTTKNLTCAILNAFQLPGTYLKRTVGNEPQYPRCEKFITLYMGKVMFSILLLILSQMIHQNFPSYF